MAIPADPASWPALRFRAMGCAMSAHLAVPPEAASAPLRQVTALFAGLEQRLSRFDPASELAQLNRRAGEWAAVSPLLWEVVEAALDLTEETGGLFDPTLLAALEAAGYDRPFEQVAAAVRDDRPMTTGPFTGHARAVERRPGREVRLPPGVRLDLGGIAKGYAAQQAAAFLRQWGPCLVDAGGDLAAGDAPPGWPGWPVGVAAPTTAESETSAQDQDLLLLWLANAAAATSGIDYRHWRRGGQLQHHIIDPRSGLPAVTDLLTATVVDASAVRAEAWATAALVMGAAVAGQTWLRQGVAGALVQQDGRVRVTPTLHSAVAWPTLDQLEPVTTKENCA